MKYLKFKMPSKKRLRFIVEPQSIVVLVASDRKELQQMQVFHDLLTESFVILVLPDGEESTIRLAHLLQPRFITQRKAVAAF